MKTKMNFFYLSLLLCIIFQPTYSLDTNESVLPSRAVSSEPSKKPQGFSKKLKILFGSVVTCSLLYGGYRYSVLSEKKDPDEEEDIEKPTIEQLDNAPVHVTFWSITDIGGRSSQEDRFCVLPNYSLGPFAGVFDGHGGSDVAEFVKNKLPAKIEKTWTPECSHFKDRIESCSISLNNKLKKFNFQGTTATYLCVRNNKIYVGNTGDSRTIISRDGKAEQITKDHKPDEENEMTRIEEAGGRHCPNPKFLMSMGGTLSVSRAFGDFAFTGVIAEPDVFEVELTPDIEFAVLASDGLWDTVNNDDVIKIIREGIPNNDIQNAILQRLVTTAKNNGSRDNITIIIVYFHDLETLKKKLAEKA